jgi:hypothetical protein
VSLKQLIAAGLLKPPLNLNMHYKGREFKAELLPDGTIRFQGKIFKTCSAAAGFAKSAVAGRRMTANGWYWWHHQDQDGNPVPLDAARQKYLKRKGK